MTSPNDRKITTTSAPSNLSPRKGLLAALRSSRTLRQAFKAWGRGSLEEAQALLEPAGGAAQGNLGALFLLARVLAEKGEMDRALSLIEEAALLRPEAPVPQVFRAMILLDLGRESAARDGLERLRGSNLLARALCALLDLKEKLRLQGGAGQVTMTFPVASRWISHVSGRLLALLEEEYFARRKAEAMEFHCSIFDPKGRAANLEKEGKEGTPAKEGEAGPADAAPGGPEAGERKLSERGAPKTRKEWQQAVEDAFRGRRHEDVESLCREGGPSTPWMEPGLQVLHALSLLCMDKDQRASTLLGRCLRESPSAADFHFLQGLCHVRKGHVPAAGLSFCRAARLADVDVDHISQEILKKLNLQVYFEG